MSDLCIVDLIGRGLVTHYQNETSNYFHSIEFNNGFNFYLFCCSSSVNGESNMKQFHDGISSKTFKKSCTVRITFSDLICTVAIGLVLSML